MIEKPLLSSIFSSNTLRIVTEHDKNRGKGPTEIPLEIEPLEGSPLYHVLPDSFQDNTTIYGFVRSNPALNKHFTLTSMQHYGNRYIIFRESSSHYLVIFVSDDEKKMHFYRYEKNEIINLVKDCCQP